MPVDLDRAVLGIEQAAQCLGELRLAVSGHAGDAEDLAALHFETGALELASRTQLVDDEAGTAVGLRCNRAAFGYVDAMSDHQLGELRFAGLTGIASRDEASVAQHRHPPA